ncbi:MAG: hypothetical protein II956_07235 [Bacteroidales bacterium]|nr:hypothetical protein [Bacteroidales bacterium]
MKRSNLFSVIAILSFALLSGTSCQDEEVKVSNENFTKGNVSEVFNKDSVLTIDGKRMEWKLYPPTSNKRISKGLVFDETGRDDPDAKLEIDTVYCHSDPKKKYLALKVDRISQPGKFFYIMIDNLDIKYHRGCWAYNNNENNVKKYGYLYNWATADILKNDVYMKLRDYRSNGKPTKITPHHGKLPSVEDIKDLLEVDYEVSWQNPRSVYDLCGWDMFYYDAFLCGLEQGTHADCDKTFAGERYEQYNPQISMGWYTDLNNRGFYRMENKNNCFVLQRRIDYHIQQDYPYEAYIHPSCNYTKEEGGSVRYVFEPKYQ